METALYYLRWLALLPVAVVAYFSVQILMLLFGIPYLRGQIIDDPPGAVEISSHFFWDWIVQPFAYLCIGFAASSVALMSGAKVAPSHKVMAVRGMAIIVLLWAFPNFVFALFQLRTASVSGTLPALAANFQAGLVAIAVGLRFKTENELFEQLQGRDSNAPSPDQGVAPDATCQESVSYQEIPGEFDVRK